MLLLFQSVVSMMLLIILHVVLWYEQWKHAVLVDDCCRFLILIQLPTPNSFSSGHVIPGWFKIPCYQIIKYTSSFYLYVNLCIYIVYINLYIKLLDCASVCEPAELTPFSFSDQLTLLVRTLESFFSIGIFVLLTRKWDGYHM
jgi:quinol-cytochrome oxidoreductase complex cytochrome b subunit